VTYSDRLKDFPQDLSTRIFDHLLAGDEAEQRFRLDGYFRAIAGPVEQIDLTDGIRMTTRTGAVIHLRRSGNAPELRCYSEADDRETAVGIAEAALAVVAGQLVARFSKAAG
jgi:phosphomannomutase